MTTIIGIDPGLTHTGWGIISCQGDRLSYIDSGTISTKTTSSLAMRLAEISQALQLVISKYKPEAGAIEETFVNKNPLSSLKLGHARGAAMLTISLHNISLSEYAATQVKKAVVGVGKAEKHQVEMMIKHLLPGATISSPDAADALAVAVCHSAYLRGNYDR